MSGGGHSFSEVAGNVARLDQSKLQLGRRKQTNSCDKILRSGTRLLLRDSLRKWLRGRAVCLMK